MFGQGDGKAGGRGAGTDDGDAHAPRFVDHFAADTAAAEQDAVLGGDIFLQSGPGQFIQAVVTADIFDL